MGSSSRGLASSSSTGSNATHVLPSFCTHPNGMPRLSGPASRRFAIDCHSTCAPLVCRCHCHLTISLSEQAVTHT
eukprot:scaffold86246_cov33-Tisochrysis_lutea.AAC.2